MKGFSHLEVSGGVKEIDSSLSLAFLLTLALYIVNLLEEYRIGRHRSLVLDVSLGCAESNQRSRFFSVAEKRSLTLSLENDEYEVREAAGTMDPLTPNRVTFLGLAGVACRS